MGWRRIGNGPLSSVSTGNGMPLGSTDVMACRLVAGLANREQPVLTTAAVILFVSAFMYCTIVQLHTKAARSIE